MERFIKNYLPLFLLLILLDKGMAQGRAGIVEIESQPAGAKVYIDGRVMGKTPLKVELAAGRHRLRIHAAGYMDEEEEITIMEGLSVKVFYTLKRLCTLTILTSPPAGNVIVDGNRKGPAPVKVSGLAAGGHDIRVEKKGYRGYSERLELKPGEGKTLNLELIPMEGKVLIKTEPPAAQVYLDGKYAGTSPVRAEVKAGTHKIVIRDPLCEFFQKEETIGPGSDVELFYELKGPGSIKVSTTPEGAKVYLDDKLKGESPVKIEKVAPGTHALSIEMPGYKMWKGKVKVESEKTTPASVVLEQTSVILRLSSNPSGAEILINGKRAGTTPFMYKVMPGQHTILAKMEGYVEKEINLNIEPGVIKKDIDFFLERGGMIKISSRPSGATLFIDGKEMGKTPAEIGGIASGQHEVRLEMGNYYPYRDEVKIEGGVSWVKDVTLKPKEGSVEIKIEIEGANILVDGNCAGVTPLKPLSLSPGLHNIKIEKEGYLGEEWKVEIAPGSKMVLDSRMEKLGGVRVDSDPPGAEVFINDIPKGKTPADKILLDPGKYRILLKKERYVPCQEVIDVALEKILSVSAKLVPMNCRIRIKSTPDGAEVYEGQKSLGKTPVEITVPHDSYRFSFTKKGFKDEYVEIKVEPGDEKDIDISLKKLGEIIVHAKPEGSIIEVNGEEAGVTTVHLKELDPGEYEIRVRKEHYHPFERTVNIGYDRVERVECELKGKDAGIEVSSIPLKAGVSLDGEFKGETPITIEGVPPGTHRLSLSLKGFKKVGKELNIEPESFNRFDIEIPRNKIFGRVGWSSLGASVLAGMLCGYFSYSTYDSWIKYSAYDSWYRQGQVAEEERDAKKFEFQQNLISSLISGTLSLIAGGSTYYFLKQDRKYRLIEEKGKSSLNIGTGITPNGASLNIGVIY